jgi:SAM-dependent methyltransferase
MNSTSFFPATSMPDPDWWQALWPDPDAVVRDLGLQSQMAVLDVCCGDGRFTPALCRRASPGGVLAIDLDAGELALARSACAAENCDNVSFVEGDVSDLSLLVSDPQDYVFIANTFHGIPDKVAFARGVRKVLKPGGRLVIVNWHDTPRERTPVAGQPRGPANDMRLSPDACAEAISAAGFVLNDLVELKPYHYGAVFIVS